MKQNSNPNSSPAGEDPQGIVYGCSRMQGSLQLQGSARGAVQLCLPCINLTMADESNEDWWLLTVSMQDWRGI